MKQELLEFFREVMPDRAYSFTATFLGDANFRLRFSQKLHAWRQKKHNGV